MRFNARNIRRCRRLMTWVGFVAILLVACQAGAQQIVCVGADGSVHVETAGDKCCPIPSFPADANCSGTLGIGEDSGCCIDCRDIPVERVFHLSPPTTLQHTSSSLVCAPAILSGDPGMGPLGPCLAAALADAPATLPLLRSVLRC